MAITIKVQGAKAKGSKGKAKRVKGCPVTCKVEGGAGGGNRYTVIAPNGETCPATKFTRLLGYAGFSKAMATALLTDARKAAGEKNPVPSQGMVSTQVGDGRAAYYGRSTFHGGVEAGTVETFGSIVASARDYYLSLCGEKGTLDADAAKKPAKDGEGARWIPQPAVVEVVKGKKKAAKGK